MSKPRTDAKGRASERLKGAYELATPEDNRAYYQGFADEYDDGFAAALGYALPPAIARAYRAVAGDADIPVADIGCGTGLVLPLWVFRQTGSTGWISRPTCWRRRGPRGCTGR